MIILLYVLTELEHILNVMLERKGNVVLKTLLLKIAKAQPKINGLVKKLFYAINLNIHLFNSRQIDRLISSGLIFQSLFMKNGCFANFWCNLLCFGFSQNTTPSALYLK